MSAYGRQLALVADPIDDAWIKFHHAHPEVAEHLTRLAREWKAAGFDRVGISLLWEVMRWQRGLMTGLADEDGLRLNNNYRSRYARHLMATHRDLAGFFLTRQLHTDMGEAM